MRTIDLNSDLGEGFGPWKMGDDAAMLSEGRSIRRPWPTPWWWSNRGRP